MKDTLIGFFLKHKLFEMNKRVHCKYLSFFMSKRPLTGAVRIKPLGNSRGVPSFFSQSLKTAMLFLFQKQAPG